MPAKILDGKKIADKIKKDIKREIARLKGSLKLAALQIGSGSSSKVYMDAQIRLARELGIKYRVKVLKANVTQRRCEREIGKFNSDRSVAGIIIHAPAPKHIDTQKLFAGIAPGKDVEGLNPANICKLIYKDWVIAPCTARACMLLINATGINLRGKEAVIVGHSEITGKPLSLMLLTRMATTTVCHVETYKKGLLKGHVRRAEILIVSVGKRHLIKGSWVRKGAIVIDVGINRHKGRIDGDVDFKAVRKKASYITPVPGGVGPLTTVMLMKNLIELYKNAGGFKKCNYARN